jgi:hypothetical protein
MTKFDDVPAILEELADALRPQLVSAGEIVAVRDLWGRVRFIAQQRPEHGSTLDDALRELAETAWEKLGAHSYPPGESILYAEEAFAGAQFHTAEPGLPIGGIRPVFRLIDRQITGQSWATVSDMTRAPARRACRAAM